MVYGISDSPERPAETEIEMDMDMDRSLFLPAQPTSAVFEEGLLLAAAIAVVVWVVAARCCCSLGRLSGRPLR